MNHPWNKAARLRTLPLGIACVALGSFLALYKGHFDPLICFLTAFTILALQILSNFSNDYGDSIHGADNHLRVGPSRTVQTGAISKSQMKSALYITGLVCLISGLTLLYVADLPKSVLIGFLLLGILAIIASLNYTVGSKPYGYSGLGDLFVLIFFGWIGIMGSFYLQTKVFDWQILLPATSCGLFAVAVLNINNIRDIVSDTQAGKRSIPVRIGKDKAVIYHCLLLIIGFLCSLFYVKLNFEHNIQLLFLIIVPLLLINASAIYTKQSHELDPYLKQMALTTLLFVVSFGAGLLLSIK